MDVTQVGQEGCIDRQGTEDTTGSDNSSPQPSISATEMAAEPGPFGHRIRGTWSDSSSSTDSGSEPGIHVLSSPLDDKAPPATKLASSATPKPGILKNHRRANTMSLQQAPVDEVDDGSGPVVAKFTNIYRKGPFKMHNLVDGVPGDDFWEDVDSQLAKHPGLQPEQKPTSAEKASYRKAGIEKFLDLGVTRRRKRVEQETAVKPGHGINSSKLKPSLTIDIHQPAIMSCDGDCFRDGDFFCHGDFEKEIADFYNDRQGAKSEEHQGNVTTPTFENSGVSVEDEFQGEASTTLPTGSDHYGEADIMTSQESRPQDMPKPERRVTSPIRRQQVCECILHWLKPQEHTVQSSLRAFDKAINSPAVRGNTPPYDLEDLNLRHETEKPVHIDLTRDADWNDRYHASNEGLLSFLQTALEGALPQNALEGALPVSEESGQSGPQDTLGAPLGISDERLQSCLQDGQDALVAASRVSEESGQNGPQDTLGAASRMSDEHFQSCLQDALAAALRVSEESVQSGSQDTLVTAVRASEESEQSGSQDTLVTALPVSEESDRSGLQNALEAALRVSKESGQSGSQEALHIPPEVLGQMASAALRLFDGEQPSQQIGDGDGDEAVEGEAPANLQQAIGGEDITRANTTEEPEVHSQRSPTRTIEQYDPPTPKAPPSPSIHGSPNPNENQQLKLDIPAPDKSTVSGDGVPDPVPRRRVSARLSSAPKNKVETPRVRKYPSGRLSTGSEDELSAPPTVQKPVVRKAPVRKAKAPVGRPKAADAKAKASVGRPKAVNGDGEPAKKKRRVKK